MTLSSHGPLIGSEFFLRPEIQTEIWFPLLRIERQPQRTRESGGAVLQHDANSIDGPVCCDRLVQ